MMQIGAIINEQQIGQTQVVTNFRKLTAIACALSTIAYHSTLILIKALPATVNLIICCLPASLTWERIFSDHIQPIHRLFNPTPPIPLKPLVIKEVAPTVVEETEIPVLDKIGTPTLEEPRPKKSRLIGYILAGTAVSLLSLMVLRAVEIAFKENPVPPSETLDNAILEKYREKLCLLGGNYQKLSLDGIPTEICEITRESLQKFDDQEYINVSVEINQLSDMGAQEALWNYIESCTVLSNGIFERQNGIGWVQATSQGYKILYG